MEALIRQLAKQTKLSSKYIETLINEVSQNLINEGCSATDPRFYSYVLKRVNKKLKIEESSTIKTFKEFFKEKN